MRHPRTITAVLVGLAIVATAACGDDTAPPPASGDGPGIDELVSAEGLWFLTAGTHEGAELEVRFGEMTMEFPGDGRVVGQAGCNTYEATIDVTDEREWRAGTYALTEMACDTPGLMAAEDAFMRALDEVTMIGGSGGAAGRYVLTGGTAELHFELGPDPADLAG